MANRDAVAPRGQRQPGDTSVESQQPGDTSVEPVGAPTDGMKPGSSGSSKSRLGLALLFIGTGINHFVMPHHYKAIVPPGMGDAGTLVAVSGAAELAGGVGVLLAPTRKLAGLGLIALLAAVFPANLYMARNPERFAKIPSWALWARLPLQPLAMLWAWRATRN